jgi:uncharacterized protein (TIGR02246 family)
MKLIASSFTTILTAAILLFTNVSAHAADTDVKSEIQRLSDKFSEAASAGDAAAVAALYAEDAVLLPLEAPIVKGRAAIQDFWKPVVESGAKAKLTTTEATLAGDYVHEIGTYTIKHADGALIQEGKYLVIWKRAGKTWQIHRDIWNSNSPAAK